ncbi:hypothetical protein DXG03_004292 [Asterophora parasitica]|uniref:G-alpha-domain-containing protein n=1 Tax=Asterophora parasitica TaxID=117018 RepID=A0A9P7G0A4_9AGAR|nr:hypothetical protein DXG03_004292 [Asterophora parasitica]
MGAFERDPFAIFTTPPPDETPQEKTLRERREVEEKRVSDGIDEEIKAEKAALKKTQKSVVKVLLLGQSESGKSTTLKNFRMKYARAAWKAERLFWRAVIQLNLIRSIITVLDTLQAESEQLPITPPLPLPLSSHPSHAPDFPRDSIDSDFPDDEPRASPIQLSQKHDLLKLRLGPLRRVEKDLKRRLGDGSEEDLGYGAAAGVLGETSLGDDSGTGDGVGAVSISSRRGPRKEFGVRGWKQVLEGPLAVINSNTGGVADAQEAAKACAAVLNEATGVIVSCKEDMRALWADEDVKAVLRRRRIRMEDSAGFFLNDLDRIATRNYEPSDDDIVRARLRTTGIQEYKIHFGKDTSFLSNVGLQPDFGQEWILYDVGGSRTARNAWLPYFEAVNACIFLAPISCFDERLLEDPRVNRLEDSFLLWKAVCSSKILAKSTMILFLNKCDLLKRKLKGGAHVRTFLPSYADRPNDAVAVVKYLREKFKDILRQQSPEPRVSYFYATSVTDTKATATTLNTVRDSILREHLKNADFV